MAVASTAAATLALIMFLNAHSPIMDGHPDNPLAQLLLRRRVPIIGHRSTANSVSSTHDVGGLANNGVGKDVKCVSGAYPPDPSASSVPERVVNLDLPPHERWHDLTVEYADQMKDLLWAIRNYTYPVFHGLLFELVDKYAPKLVETLPYPFVDELKGIADTSGLALGDVAAFNLFYEVFTVCTSIIGQSPSGHLYHGRNLDFGLLLGWDKQNDTWRATEILRRMTVQVDFQRGGQTVFKATTFVGYVGIITGMKPGAFSLTVDERFKFVGGYVGIIEWFLGKRSGNWMSFLTRSALENATSYEEAQEIFTSSALLSPVYFILGGNRTGQASVITRGLKFVDVWDISRSKSWYLVQTNYDHWKKPPFWDDRRTPAKKCLDVLGQQNLTVAELFNVLSTSPMKNKLTAYTTLMEVASGTIESYLQECSDPDCPLY